MKKKKWKSGKTVENSGKAAKKNRGIKNTGKKKRVKNTVEKTEQKNS